MMFVKVELYEGKAYATDGNGDVWSLYHVDRPDIPWARKLTPNELVKELAPLRRRYGAKP